MAFPHDLKYPVLAYKLKGPDEWDLPPMNLPTLRETIENRDLGFGLLPEAPSQADLNGHYWEKNGWAYLDDNDVVSVNHYVSWSLRRYVKKVPTKTIRALVAKQKLTVREAGGKWTKHDSAVYRENLEKEMQGRTPPDVSETQLLYDCQQGMLYIFTSNKNVAQALVNKMRRLLANVYDCDESLYMEPMGLESYLDRTRPGAVLPGNFNLRFLTWAAQQGLHESWMHDGESRGVGLELMARVDLSLNDDKVTIKGGKSVERFVREETEATERGNVTTVELRLHVAPASTFAIVLDSNGRLKRAELVDPDMPKLAKTEWEESVLICGNYIEQVLDGVYWLMRAFDATWLSDAMEEEPQTQFFPGEALPVQTDEDMPLWWAQAESDTRTKMAEDNDARKGQVTITSYAKKTGDPELDDLVGSLANMGGRVEIGVDDGPMEVVHDSRPPFPAFLSACTEDKGEKAASHAASELARAMSQGPLALASTIDGLEDEHGIPADLYGHAEQFYELLEVDQ